MITKRVHLLLGGAGFIGCHVAASLLKSGARVVICDVAKVDRIGSFTVGRDFTSIVTDCADVDWDQLVGGVDVVHLYAWSSIPSSANDRPLHDLTRNLSITIQMLEALRRRGQGRVLFASSGGTVYGRVAGTPIREDAPLAPITGYGAGKAAAEMYMSVYRDLYGVDCRVARISNPYGIGQNISRGQGAVTTFIQKALADEEIVIWGDGSVVRDYLHISDVAAALMRFADLPLAIDATTLNIGSGEGVSLNQILDQLTRYVGRPLKVRREAARQFDVPTNVLDISRAKRVLCWQPELSFPAGLERAVNEARQDMIDQARN